MPRLRGVRHSLRGLVALAFVLLTLLTLVAVPVLVQERVDGLRDAIEASEPARTLVARVQFAVVREATALDELHVTAGTAGTATYDTAYVTEVAALAEMTPVVADVGLTARQHLATLQQALARWHARTNPDSAARRASGALTRPSAEVRPLLEDVIRAAAAVDAAILDANARTRARIAATERAGLVLTAVLALLASLAAVAVGTLHARVGRLVVEADARRIQAETALAEASRATEARAGLLRGITHDVKNPLGAAKGYADLLAAEISGPLTSNQAMLVDGVKRTVDRALGIVADLLDVARADAGRLPTRRLRTDLVRVVRTVVEDHHAAAEAAGLEMACVPTVDELWLDTDPARVVQVLDNLLSNAIKYTPAPGRVAVRVERDGEDGRRASVRVTDSGPGIPADRRDAIFDEFSRLREDAVPAGHGLGLAIARRIARLLGGDLFVADTPGPGATFVLLLPTADDRPAAG